MRLRRPLVLATLAVVGINAWIGYPYAAQLLHDREVASHSYQERYGRWDTIELPTNLRVNAVHAAVLRTGKILITAGSGNSADDFAAGKFVTLLYDPGTGSGKLVYTPSDLFCGGQSFLPDGRVLVAGGTQRYEVLASKVHTAGGVMTIHNDSPYSGEQLMPIGTELISPNGQKYRTDAAIIVQPAAQISGADNVSRVIASQTSVWVDAESPDQLALSAIPTRYDVIGSTDAQLYGTSTKMTMNKQEFQGSAFSYVFDPATEEYSRVADLTTKRWYPTLTPLSDGAILAVSGLDGTGQIVAGAHETEKWSATSDKWLARPDLTQFFPTYPALYQTARKDVLFYSGSSQGYGPASKGRVPGFWNVATNAFIPVPGLRDSAESETAGSAWVGPIQNQTMVIVGGGGVGTSKLATSRIDVIRLNDARPQYTPGPNLPQATRYATVVGLPDDTLLITGGSRQYRGEHGSDNHIARIYHPATNKLSYAADPQVGRDYHSAALLLPDGRVLTMGGNSLYGDKNDSKPGKFEQRLEIYTPAYLLRGARPVVTAATRVVGLGGHINVTSPDAAKIVSARLIHPGAATHNLNLEQESVALSITHQPGSLSLGVPTQATFVRPGYYMLFLLNAAGIPSVASWVQIT